MSAQAGEFDVLFVINSLSIGGSERKVVRLANSLADRGIRVGCAYFLPADALASELRPSISLWYLRRSGRFSFGALRRLRQLQRGVNARSLIAVNLYPVLYVALLCKWPGNNRKGGIRSVGLVNITAPLRSRDHWLRPLYKWALRTMTTVVYGSEAQRAVWLAGDERALQRSQVIYNGIDVEAFANQANTEVANIERASELPERFTFGTVGRLVPEKNQHVLIDALAQLRRIFGIDAHLLLVGDGLLRRSLEDHARALRVEGHVAFAGIVNDVRPYLRQMDVFVLPSTAETFSNAALEAMAMGKPVILSAVGGAGETVHHTQDGFLIPIGELSSQLAPRLAALAVDVEQRIAVGNRARSKVAAQFSLSAMTDRYQALLRT